VSETGKTMRLKRVIDPAGVAVICALDHGMTSPTFLEPLADIQSRTAEAVAGGANVIMMSKGMIRIAAPAFSPTTSLAFMLAPAPTRSSCSPRSAARPSPGWCGSSRPSDASARASACR
jgi:DhnA family fructose-bisphosphate aldolase class Ia